MNSETQGGIQTGVHRCERHDMMSLNRPKSQTYLWALHLSNTKSSFTSQILESLKEEITALKEANLKGVYSLLEHLYKHHVPSKTPKFTIKHLEDLQKNVDEPFTLTAQKQRKKLLLKACQDFHPDKFAGTVDENESQEDRDKRKVLHEEITKMITKYYEHLKMC